MLSVTIKTVKLSVIMLTAVMLNVMRPFEYAPYPFKSRNVRHGWTSLALKNTLAYLFKVKVTPKSNNTDAMFISML
jgi:hypothetical protein